MRKLCFCKSGQTRKASPRAWIQLFDFLFIGSNNSAWYSLCHSGNKFTLYCSNEEVNDCLLVSKCTNCGKKKQTHHLCFCDPFFKHFDYGCTIQRQLFLWNYKKYFATTHNSWVKMLYQPCLIPDIPRHLCLGVSCQSQIYQKEKCSQISENPILPYFESTHFGFHILIKPRSIKSSILSICM